MVLSSYICTEANDEILKLLLGQPVYISLTLSPLFHLKINYKKKLIFAVPIVSLIKFSAPKLEIFIYRLYIFIDIINNINNNSI